MTDTFIKFDAFFLQVIIFIHAVNYIHS